MENKKFFWQKPVTEKLKSWLTTPHKETRKIDKIYRNYQRAIALRNYSEIIKFHSSLLANCSFFGQSFSLGYPMYQPPKGVYLLNIPMYCYVGLCSAIYHHVLLCIVMHHNVLPCMPVYCRAQQLLP